VLLGAGSRIDIPEVEPYTLRLSSGELRVMSDEELVRVLKALGDATRFRMVQEIAAGAGQLTCGQVAERFDLSQPTISHHMKILADAGILLGRSEGKQHFPYVNQPLLDQVLALMPGRLVAQSRARRVSTPARARTD
jgi:ArsR family transcriptional regulator